MKKTSRRTFGKQLTGALVGVTAPVVAAKAQNSQSDAQKVKRATATNFRSHDTPPPLDFTNGSLVLEKQNAFHETGMNGDNTRKEYRILPQGGNSIIYPAHIKIIDGSGEMLFRMDDETGTCAVSIELRNAGGANSSFVNARALVDQTKFIVDVDPDKTFDLGNIAQGDKPTSKKRSHRYRHSAAALSMFEVIVKQDSRVVYALSPRGLPAQGADLRVMIWLEPV